MVLVYLFWRPRALRLFILFYFGCAWGLQDFSSLTAAWATAVKAPSRKHWTARELPFHLEPSQKQSRKWFCFCALEDLSSRSGCQEYFFCVLYAWEIPLVSIAPKFYIFRNVMILRKGWRLRHPFSSQWKSLLWVRAKPDEPSPSLPWTLPSSKQPFVQEVWTAAEAAGDLWWAQDRHLCAQRCSSGKLKQFPWLLPWNRGTALSSAKWSWRRLFNVCKIGLAAPGLSLQAYTSSLLLLLSLGLLSPSLFREEDLKLLSQKLKS